MNRLDLIEKLQQLRGDKVLIELRTENAVLGWKPIDSVSDRMTGDTVIEVNLCDYSELGR